MHETKKFSCKLTTFGKSTINSILHSSSGKSIPSKRLARVITASLFEVKEFFESTISLAVKMEVLGIFERKRAATRPASFSVGVHTTLRFDTECRSSRILS